MSIAAIVIPTFIRDDGERCKFFDKCLESVIAQGDQAIGLVIDDSSTFDVKSKIESFNSSNLRYFKREKQPGELSTSSNATNFGFDLILSGDALHKFELERLRGVCYLHSDDFLFPNSIKHRLAALERGNNLVYSNMICYHTILNAEFQKDGNYFRNQYKGFLHHTLMWDFKTFVALDEYCRKTYDTPGIFDPSLTAAEDRDVSISTFEVVDMLDLAHEYIPINTYGYTSQVDSITGNLTREIFNRYKLQIFRKHSLSYANYLFDNFGDIALEYYWRTKDLLPDFIKNGLTPIEKSTKNLF